MTDYANPQNGDPFMPRDSREAIQRLSMQLVNVSEDLKELKETINNMASKSYVDGAVSRVDKRLDDHIASSNERLSHMVNPSDKALAAQSGNALVEFLNTKVGWTCLILIGVIVIVGIGALEKSFSPSMDATQMAEIIKQVLVQTNGGK